MDVKHVCVHPRTKKQFPKSDLAGELAGSQTPGEKFDATAPAKCPDRNYARASCGFRAGAQSMRCLHQPEVPPTLPPLPHPKNQGDVNLKFV